MSFKISISDNKNLSPHSPTTLERKFHMQDYYKRRQEALTNIQYKKKKIEEPEANENSVVIYAPLHTAI